jgi:putative DNA-invertase from lambdoid prophage Rac
MTSFAYCLSQTTEAARIKLIQVAGIEPVTERVSCSTPALKRPAFKALIERLTEGDTLVLASLSDAGSDPIDVFNTLALCLERNIKLVIAELSDSDLTSSREMLKVVTAYSDLQHMSVIEKIQNDLHKAE